MQPKINNRKASRDSMFIFSNEKTNNRSDEAGDMSTTINYTAMVNDSSILHEELSPI